MIDRDAEERRDAYLWDRSGPVDDDVAALERLLARFGHGVRRRRRMRVAWSAAALLLVAGFAVWGLIWTGGAPVTPQDGIVLRVGDADGPRLRDGEWLEARHVGERLLIGEVGEVRLEPGARLMVRTSRRGRVELFLANGELEAIVSPDVVAGFFRVATPAATCIDLGCRYTLRVDRDSGESRVVVTLGKVAFESGDRRVLVPRRAEARAQRGGRLGTPRSVDAALRLASALDAYDASAAGSAERLAAAGDACMHASLDIDTLPLWHLLADPDQRVAEIVERTLIRRFGVPDGWKATKGGAAIPRDVWLAFLEPLWY